MFGGLAVASDSAEIFLLEYADGMDAGAVGWGRVGWPEVREALELHDLAFDLLFRTPYLARRQGSSLLARVAGALTGRAFGGLPAPDLPVRDARLVAYVGHDTNISNLGGLLGATWAMPGYPVDETPPGGALMFERRRAADGRERVFLSFVAQTPGQMRSAAPLTPAAPPIRTPVRIPGCSTEEDGFPCSVDDFARVVREALDADCVARP